MTGIFAYLQDAIYDRREKYGELKALERLFTKQFLLGIKKSEENAIGKRQQAKVGVDLAWIDKIPLASFSPPQNDLAGHRITNRVEIGDLLIHRTDSVITPSDIFIRDSRTAIVQAKISKSVNPIIPIGRLSRKSATSTSKEIKLLQDWPTFDLFETSGSKTHLLKNVSVNSSKKNSFFWAFVRQSNKWLSGEAVNGTPCNESLDDFFSKLRAHTYGESVQSQCAWSDLSFSIIGVAKNRNIPQSLNKKVRSRVQSTTYQTAGFGSSLFSRRKIAVLMIDSYFDESDRSRHAP